MPRKMKKVHFMASLGKRRTPKPICGVHPWDGSRKDGTPDTEKVTCWKCLHHKIFLEADNADE